MRQRGPEREIFFPEAHRKAHRQWLLAKLERLQDLLAKDPAQAKAEISRHLAGNLSLHALPSPAAERDDWRSPEP
jgi:hypothetical protein